LLNKLLLLLLQHRVPLNDLHHLDPAVADAGCTDFKRLQGHLHIQATYQVIAMLFEGVTERVYGRTFASRGLARAKFYLGHSINSLSSKTFVPSYFT